MRTAPLPALLLLMLLACVALVPSALGVAVGAIRWDAWYGVSSDPNVGQVGNAVTNDLSPQQYHYRLPFFAKEQSSANASQVDVNGNSDAVMSEEIVYARQFGIDFWAFCTYPIGCKDYHPPASECPQIQCCADNYPLSYALLRYLENPNNHLVNFSLILQSSNGGGWFPVSTLGGNETLQQEVTRYATYFKMSNYQKVLDGRPLVFFFPAQGANVTGEIQALTQASLSATGKAPYYVVMGGGGDSASDLNAQALKIGAQAVSRYVTAINDNTPGQPASYQNGIAQNELAFWADAASSGAKLVPPISAGWDPRPRQHYPVPWGGSGCVDCYVTDPTMDELEAQTRAGVEFALNNAATVEAQAVIISAWNENDEGHWIIPSLFNGTEKLQAVQRGIASASKTAP